MSRKLLAMFSRVRGFVRRVALNASPLFLLYHGLLDFCTFLIRVLQFCASSETQYICPLRVTTFGGVRIFLCMNRRKQEFRARKSTPSIAPPVFRVIFTFPQPPPPPNPHRPCSRQVQSWEGTRGILPRSTRCRSRSSRILGGGER